MTWPVLITVWLFVALGVLSVLYIESRARVKKKLRPLIKIKDTFTPALEQFRREAQDADDLYGLRALEHNAEDRDFLNWWYRQDVTK